MSNQYFTFSAKRTPFQIRFETDPYELSDPVEVQTVTAQKDRGFQLYVLHNDLLLMEKLTVP